AVVLTILAYRFELPVAHAPALACLTIGYLTAFHLLAGHLHEPYGLSLLYEVWSAESGLALVGLVVALVVVGEGTLRKGLARHGIFYTVGAGVLALGSLLLVTRQGIVQPERATLVYGIYGAGSLLLTVRWRRPVITYAGLALLVGATLWDLHWQQPANWPVWALVLA